MTFKANTQYYNAEAEQQFDSDTIIVLDGDEIVFQCAAACETRGITVINKSNEAEATFKTRTDFKAFVTGLEIPEDFFQIEDTQIAEDPKNAFATVKAKINNYKRQFNTDKVELYLYGGGNFRSNLPLPIKYKSTRADTLKPLLLEPIREYLLKYQGAVLVEGTEVDDMVAQRMYDGVKSGQKIIGVSIDKDALGYVGWLYNPDKMTEPKYLEGFGELYIDDKGKVRGQGRIWTWHQCLIGDSVDVYDPRDIATQLKGKAPRFGEKSSHKILSVCKNDREALAAIKKQYIEWYGEERFTYKCWEGKEHEVDWVDLFQMYFDCVRMRRWKDDLVDVRAMLKRLGVIE
jgi:hypothetical protein